MDSLGRLLLRVMLVPLGYFAAVIAGVLVILLGSWRLGLAAAMSNSDLETVAAFGLVFAAPVLLVVLLSVMWLPGAIGILISEAFAIRSWIFHAGNGVVTAWIGWNLFGHIDDSRMPIHQPMTVVAAGAAAGLAYWLVAGWSAGFWKPVFHRMESTALARAIMPSRAPKVR
jgi:hypothetical protein